MGIRAWNKKVPTLSGDLVYSAEIDAQSAKNGGTFKFDLEHGKFTLKLPAGKIVEGTRLRLAGAGQRPIVGGPAGDLYFEFSVRDHVVKPGVSPRTMAIIGVFVTIGAIAAIQMFMRSGSNVGAGAGIAILPIGLLIYLWRRK
jgi:DnaJ-class molecular chaperone